MVRRSVSAPTLVVTVVFLVSALVGCGGGGGGGGSNVTPTPLPSSTPTPQPTPTPTPTPLLIVPRLTLGWGARSRATGNLTSALSATVRLREASVDGSDIVFTVDRDARLAEYTQTFTAPAPARAVPILLEVTFFAATGGTGEVVGRAGATVQMQPDGLLPDVAVQGVIASVEVAPGQIAYVGEASDLAVAGKDAEGRIIAVSPGSIFVTSTEGSVLRAQGPRIEGVAPGQSQIVAQVDGISSPPQALSVTSRIVVTVAPAAPRVAVNGTIPFVATLAPLPAGASPAVTWQVEGAGSGTITPGGLYTAPATPGVYTVIASSVYEPSKRAIVPVTVEAGDISVGVDFPGSGGIVVGID